MPGHEFFERLLPRFALQSGAAKKTADRQADAERLIARAEYECVQTAARADGRVRGTAVASRGANRRAETGDVGRRNSCSRRRQSSLTLPHFAHVRGVSIQAHELPTLSVTYTVERERRFSSTGVDDAI
jgi:hypothetical protein